MKICGMPGQFLPFDPRQDRSAPELGDGAVGFDELGVFGLNRPRQAGTAGPPPTSSMPEAAPAAASGAARRPNVARVDIEAAASTISLPPEAAPSADSGDARPPNPARVDFEATAPTSPSAPGTGPVAGDMVAPEEPHPGPVGDPEPGQAAESSARAPAPAPASQSSATHAVLVAAKDGKVSIAVKAPPLDSDGRALLRRLLRQILAERRLGLADFHLNGGPFEADFLSMTGGSHGPRTR